MSRRKITLRVTPEELKILEGFVEKYTDDPGDMTRIYMGGYPGIQKTVTALEKIFSRR